MDQSAWNEIYTDFENDIADLTKRGGTVDPDVYLHIDRARFAVDRGDNSAAIGIIQDLRAGLGRSAKGATRAAAAVPTLDRLDALEERLHTESRLGSARLEVVGEEEETPTRSASRNTKVNKSIKYEDISDEFIELFKTVEIRDEKRAAVKAEANRVVTNRAVYEEIEEDTKVPWWFIGLIHGMVCSFSLNKHLHNGDSLKARTWQVPAGRPKAGSPPFTFHDSAVDALTVDGFAGKTDWPLSMVLFRLERYNGWGYRRKFGFASPYLWSYTNHFTSGKYVRDGVFDPDAPSKQCGAAAMLKDLMERGVVSFEDKAAVPAAVAAVAAPQPVQVAVPPVAAPAPVAAAPAPQPAPVAAPAPAVVAAPAPPAAPVAIPAAAPAAPAAAAAGVSPAVASALAALAAASKPAADAAETRGVVSLAGAVGIATGVISKPAALSALASVAKVVGAAVKNEKDKK